MKHFFVHQRRVTLKSWAADITSFTLSAIRYISFGRYSKISCTRNVLRLKFGGGGGGCILESPRPSVRLSACHPVRVSGRVRTISPEPLDHFNIFLLFFSFTKLGVVVYYHEVECHAEKWVHYLQCQDHSDRAYIIKIGLFLLLSSKLLHPTLV